MSSESTHAMPPVRGPTAGVQLVVVEGPDAGSTIDVAGPIRVGTSEACDLQLTDRSVSRRHLRVEPSALGATVWDEHSRNGTWLGAAQVRHVELAPDGELQIGGTRLRLEAHRDAAADPEATARDEAPRSCFGRFVGSAPALQPMYRQLERAAISDVTVILEGESGTGKELLAEALHDEGHRAGGPFEVVDCASIPGTLIESELFGHVRGAFTGADRDRTGALERADGGTLFLDEIAELPLTLQTRLLRVLDRREVRRVGSSETFEIDVRIVAATNRNLDREVEDGRFRMDLFHRLAVALLRVPPLRERGGDIETLARHFVQAYGGDEQVLGEDVLERMRRHDWPGNVRELRNYVERLILLGEGEPLQPGRETNDPVRAAASSGLPYRQARAQALEAFTEIYLDDMLSRHGGNISQAARAAGIARRHFQRLRRGE